MLKLKHKLISILILATPILSSAGIATTVHASGLCNTCGTCQPSCLSTRLNSCSNLSNCQDITNCKNCKDNNCISINGMNYNCGNLGCSILGGIGCNK